MRIWFRKYSRVLKWALAYISVIVLFAIMFLVIPTGNWGGNEQIHNFGDAFYFSVVTITSLGFGDIYPAAGSLGRYLVAAEAIIGIIIIGFFLNDVAQRQAIRLDEQNRKIEEEKKASKALEELKTYHQILQPVFDRYLRGIYMMVTPMKEKFNMPKDIFHQDFDFQYKDLSNIYEQTILMSSDLQVPSIEAHFKNQDILFEELRYFVTNADLSYWTEMRNLVYSFITLHHTFQVRDIIINNRHRRVGNDKIFSAYIAEQIAKFEDVPAFESGNMFSPYVALYHTTISNKAIVRGIYLMMEEILNQNDKE